MRRLVGLLLLATSLIAVLAVETVVSTPGSTNLYAECNYQCPVIAPVCGTDGNTYSSSCYLECVKKKQTQGGQVSVRTTVSSIGRCPNKPCNCPAVDYPVCGTNGWTYPNRCELRCDSAKHQQYGYPPIYEKSIGRCPGIACNCPQHVHLVCGTDGRTYGNPCKLYCESKRLQTFGRPPIFIASYGRCPAPVCNCPTIIAPVCGTDGRTYRNTCFLECASRINIKNGRPPIYIQRYGVCRVERCRCPNYPRPVCASDGNTYNNDCALRCQNEIRFALGQRPLIKLYNGPCKGCVCPKNYDPVCGSDGKTYHNLCALRCENQRRWYQHLPPLTYTKGECGCYCPYVWRPVCASNFQTFPNQCALGCENRRRVHAGLPPLYIAHYGECRCNCDSTYKHQVCGSNRITYYNVCWFNCANFYRIRNGQSPITIVKNGPC